MVLVVATIIKFLLFPLMFVLPWATVLTLLERRQSAYSQDRYGPTRAHFFTFRGKPVVLWGLFHPIADALKMFFKEITEPDVADKRLFRLAPVIGFVTSMVILALIPFGPDLATRWGVIPLQIARVDSGILLIFAVSSLSVYGVTLAGWASNSRYALLGSLRAVAQMISYEVALGLTVVGVLIAYGATELSAIVDAQSGLSYGFLPRWGLFAQPLGATLFLIAAMAETKRTPFDMPEGESEIIGYFLEYSSMGFGLFMLGEFIEITILAALFTTLFLGGWQLPWVIGSNSVSLGFVVFEGSLAVAIAGVMVFALKVMLLSVFQLQVRWTLPRFRYDQVMDLGWKMLLPLALINIFATSFFVWWDPTLGILTHVGIVLMVLFTLVVIAGPKRALEVS